MSIQEITYDTSWPSCHVCGALMAHARVMGTWECLSCDATTCIVPVQEKEGKVGEEKRCSSQFHDPSARYCLRCLPRDAPLTALLIGVREPTAKEVEEGTKLESGAAHVLAHREEAHHYISTACQHGKHALCRRVCKYCGAGCACTECTHPEKETA